MKSSGLSKFICKCVIGFGYVKGSAEVPVSQDKGEQAQLRVKTII